MGSLDKASKSMSYRINIDQINARLRLALQGKAFNQGGLEPATMLKLAAIFGIRDISSLHHSLREELRERGWLLRNQVNLPLPPHDALATEVIALVGPLVVLAMAQCRLVGAMRGLTAIAGGLDPRTRRQVANILDLDREEDVEVGLRMRGWYVGDQLRMPATDECYRIIDVVFEVIRSPVPSLREVVVSRSYDHDWTIGTSSTPVRVLPPRSVFAHPDAFMTPPHLALPLAVAPTPSPSHGLLASPDYVAVTPETSPFSHYGSPNVLHMRLRLVRSPVVTPPQAPRRGVPGSRGGRSLGPLFDQVANIESQPPPSTLPLVDLALALGRTDPELTECCVCYEQRSLLPSRCCGYSLCAVCCSQLSRALCPGCRTPLPDFYRSEAQRNLATRRELLATKLAKLCGRLRAEGDVSHISKLATTGGGWEPIMREFIEAFLRFDEAPLASSCLEQLSRRTPSDYEDWVYNEVRLFSPVKGLSLYKAVQIVAKIDQLR
jgi:hypothetical protein